MFDIAIDGNLTDSKEEGLDHLYNFTARSELQGGYNYAMLFDLDDDVYNIVERIRMPCWGAIREYECGTRPDDEWPEDLREPRHLFPEEGKPVAISFRFHAVDQIASRDHEAWNRFIAGFAFNEDESPWASILGEHELVICNDLIVGVLFKDTKVDPTAIVSIMRACGSGYSVECWRRWGQLVDEGIHPKVAFLAVRPSFVRIDPNHYFNGTTMDRCDGVTFYERASYNRPRVDYVFGGDGKTGVSVVGNNIDKMQLIYEDWLSSREEDYGRVSVSTG